MKRIPMILLALFLLFQFTHAQQVVLKMDNSIFKVGESNLGLFNFHENSFWAYVATNNKKVNYENPNLRSKDISFLNYSLKQFNFDLEQIDSIKKPEYLPKEFTTTSFGNYIAFNGTNDINDWYLVVPAKSIFKSKSYSRKENLIIFTDQEFNLVKEIKHKVNNENYGITDSFKLIVSDDGTKLFTIDFINEATGKSDVPKLKAYIFVYDLKLDVVWEKSFYTSEYMGIDPKNIHCMILNDNRIVIVSNEEDATSSKLRVCIFTEPESEPMISTYIFKYPILSLKVYRKDNGKVVIGGLAYENDLAKEMTSGWLFHKENAKEIFYLTYNLNNYDFLIENSIKLDQTFYASNPEISKSFELASDLLIDFEIQSQQYFIPWGDGSLLVINGSYYSNGKGIFYSKPIAFISFNRAGEVKWIKVIPKLFAAQSYELISYSVFVKDDKLQIFYYTSQQNAENMVLPRKIVKLVPDLFYSELDVDGNLTPCKLLSKSNLKSPNYCIPKLYRLSDNIFITGRKFLYLSVNKPAGLGLITILKE